MTKSKNSTAFQGDVNGNIINGLADVKVDVSSGVATIKPSSGLLTSLTFTPENGLLFSDFSFRGQLENDGNVFLIVQGSQSGTSAPFTFGPFDANENITRQGIHSLDGDTIEWVKIYTDTNNSFKEQKQDEFSFAVAAVPEPSTVVAGALLLLPFGASALRAIKKKAK